MAASGYTRQASAHIQPNLDINSEDLNAEFNALAQAFDSTSGHDHTGSVVGDGQKINLTTAVTGTLPIANGGSGSATATGTGLLVLQSSPTINTPTLTAPTVSGGMTVTGSTTLGATTTAGLTTQNIAATGGINVTGNSTITGQLNATTGIFDNSSRVYSPNNQFGVATNTFSTTTVTSTTSVMMGCNQTFTPTKSTRVLVCMAGSMGNNTAGDGVQVDFRYGTGTPPLYNAAAVGAVIGVNQAFTTASTALACGFSFPFILTGLTDTTTYWFDLSIKAVTGGTASVSSVMFSITEI